MRSTILRTALFGSLLFAGSGCFVRQGAHSLGRVWMDYNTQRAPAFYMEQVEHMPYHKERVAYFRWMYDKDPGHQYSKLGPLPPRAEVDPECPCPPDLHGQKGVPGPTQPLWRDGVPMPVDPSVFAPPTPAPTTGFAPQTPASPSTAAVPSSTGQNGVSPPAAPVYQIPLPPMPRDAGPVDIPPPPVYGPTAKDWGDFRVIGNSATAVQRGSAPTSPNSPAQ